MVDTAGVGVAAVRSGTTGVAAIHRPGVAAIHRPGVTALRRPGVAAIRRSAARAATAGRLQVGAFAAGPGRIGVTVVRRYGPGAVVVGRFPAVVAVVQ
jgi:hypothetical protein